MLKRAAVSLQLVLYLAVPGALLGYMCYLAGARFSSWISWYIQVVRRLAQ